MTPPALLLLAALQTTPPDTIAMRPVETAPREADLSPGSLGRPSLRLQTGQGVASIWLLRSPDSAFVVAHIPDSSYYWGDDLVISLDVEGNRGATPQHDDFQWYFRRALDSSVVYRGRAGRWEAPRGDPDWRLGDEREGGGWAVSSRNSDEGWALVLRMDPAWFAGAAGRRPAMAFRIYDDSPGGWYAWPAPGDRRQPTGVERSPDLWGTVGD